MKHYVPVQQIYTVKANTSIDVAIPFCGYETLCEKYHVFLAANTRKLLYEIVNLNGVFNTYGLLGEHVLIDVDGVVDNNSVQLRITNNEPSDFTAIIAKYEEESYGLRVSHECSPIVLTPNSSLDVLEVYQPTKILTNINDEYVVEVLALPTDEHSVSYLGSGPYDVGVQFGKFYVNNASTSNKDVSIRYTRLDDLCSTKTFDILLNSHETQVVDMSMLNTSEAVKWIFGSDDLLCELTALESNGKVYTDTYYIGNYIDADVTLVNGDRIVLSLTNTSSQTRQIKGTKLEILKRC